MGPVFDETQQITDKKNKNEVKKTFAFSEVSNSMKLFRYQLKYFNNLFFILTLL